MTRKQLVTLAAKELQKHGKRKLANATRKYLVKAVGSKFIGRMAQEVQKKANEILKMARGDAPGFDKEQWRKIGNGLVVGKHIISLVEGALLIAVEDSVENKSLQVGIERLGKLKMP